ncbi:hypothetical protein [Streptomyces curacoi]|uniref:hypothetical protein n=1 Tax=Streptomyces curacoi TaxID=146536 RepID=UPI001428C179|nr:hypothetical protein [Streptomyces curacoi]
MLAEEDVIGTKVHSGTMPSHTQEMAVEACCRVPSPNASGDDDTDNCDDQRHSGQGDCHRLGEHWHAVNGVSQSTDDQQADQNQQQDDQYDKREHQGLPSYERTGVETEIERLGVGSPGNAVTGKRISGAAGHETDYPACNPGDVEARASAIGGIGSSTLAVRTAEGCDDAPSHRHESHELQGLAHFVTSRVSKRRRSLTYRSTRCVRWGGARSLELKRSHSSHSMCESNTNQAACAARMLWRATATRTTVAAPRHWNSRFRRSRERIPELTDDLPLRKLEAHISRISLTFSNS